jgi:peroxiredoxin Q/BCP
MKAKKKKKATTKKTKMTKAKAKKTIKKAAKKSTGKKIVKIKSTTKKVKASPKLAVGAQAPHFALASDNHGTIDLDQYLGKKNVLLYFYPKDDTPGCTMQACTFQESIDKYERFNTVVLGVSGDNAKSHAKFRTKYNLSFPLLMDEDHRVAKAYGVWVEKNMYGKKSMGIQRATFLINKDGYLTAIWPKVKVDGHNSEVISILKGVS